MEPKSVNRDAFTVLGVVEHFASAAENSGPLWQEFMSYHDQIQPLSVDQSYYGVYLGTDHAKPLDYLAGMAVEDVDAVPECLVVRELPAAQYAVFECTLKTLGPTYGTIWKEWLPSSPYELDVAAFGFDFHRPNTTSGDSPMHIYFPIKARQKGKEAQ